MPGYLPSLNKTETKKSNKKKGNRNIELGRFSICHVLIMKMFFSFTLNFLFLSQIRIIISFQSVTASDLDCIRALFNEKEKELSLAVAKVEELTRQLEELRGRRNNGSDHLPTTPASAELEKLRRELMVITKNNKNKQKENQQLYNFAKKILILTKKKKKTQLINFHSTLLLLFSFSFHFSLSSIATR